MEYIVLHGFTDFKQGQGYGYLPSGAINWACGSRGICTYKYGMEFSPGKDPKTAAKAFLFR